MSSRGLGYIIAKKSEIIIVDWDYRRDLINMDGKT